MAKAKFSYRLNYPAILRLQVTTSAKLAHKGAESVRDRARRFAPIKTGALRESIIVEPVFIGVNSKFKVYSPLDHATYQEWGTGPIFARPGGVLRWTDGANVIFARRTRGVPAVHFMAKAGATITIHDFQ